jgi:nicotinate-nucleotide adenylyltransferase
MPSRLAAKSFGSSRVRLPYAAPGQRIGLLGGSFNPPHKAHVAISEAVLTRLGLDQVWWLVSPGNPLKNHDELAPLAERLAACRRIARDPRIRVTGLEAELGSAYTAVTLAFLRRRLPGVHFVWVMGGDNLAGFHRWTAWRRIAALMPIAVVDRPHWRSRALASPAARALAGFRLHDRDARGLALAAPPAWAYLGVRLHDDSSTGIRVQRRQVLHFP